MSFLAALTFDTPMGSMAAAGTFKADGNNLSGTIESQAVGQGVGNWTGKA